MVLGRMVQERSEGPQPDMIMPGAFQLMVPVTGAYCPEFEPSSGVATMVTGRPGCTIWEGDMWRKPHFG